MINNKKLFSKRFFTTTAIFIVVLCMWFFDYIPNALHDMDKNTYLFLNGLLTKSDLWANIVGIFNNHKESWINFIFMVFINVFIIAQQKRSARKSVILQTLYYWFCFQIILCLTHVIFQDFMHIRRLSPSIVFADTHVSINSLLSVNSIKEISNSSFPAGHTLVAIYWCMFSFSFKPSPIIKSLIIATTFVLCTNRLFTGAHWLTDILFTLNYGYFCYLLFSCFPKNKLVDQPTPAI